MLSVCMIARDEAQTIKESILSVLDIATEVILVDTGSNDSTPVIAEELGVRVYRYPWNNSFSEARNRALSHAQQPWVLCLDADEVLENGQCEKIRRMLTKPSADAYTVRICNLLGTIEQNEVMTGHALRLFRRDSRYQYRGRIHEEVESSILETGGVIAASDINVIHYGYLEELTTLKSRYERNVTLLQTELKLCGEQPKLLFDLATEYYIAGQMQDAARHYKRALYLCDASAAYHPRLCRNLAEAYRQLGEFDQSLKMLQNALHHYPDYGDLWFLLGLLLRDLKEKQDALEAFSEALGASTLSVRYETNVTVCREKSYLNRAELLFELGQPEKALEDAMRCIELNVRLVSAYLVAAKSLAALGRLGSAAEVLELATQVAPDERGLRELAARFHMLSKVSDPAR